MKILLLTCLIVLTCGIKGLAEAQTPPTPPIPNIPIPKYECHYEVNGKGELEKVCGWY